MSPNPRTYIGSGKVAEIKSAIHAFDVETVIFDDELSPGFVLNYFNSDTFTVLNFHFFQPWQVCDCIFVVAQGGIMSIQ